MKPKYTRANQLTPEEKKLNRSRRRFMLSVLKGVALAGVATAAGEAKANEGWFIDPETSAD